MIGRALSWKEDFKTERNTQAVAYSWPGAAAKASPADTNVDASAGTAAAVVVADAAAVLAVFAAAAALAAASLLLESLESEDLSERRREELYNRPNPRNSERF
jgi:hypothetical protein